MTESTGDLHDTVRRALRGAQQATEHSSDDGTGPAQVVSLTRDMLDSISAANDDIVTEFVPVPEWARGKQDPAQLFAIVRGLTGAERDKWEASLVQGKGKNRNVNLDNARAKLVALCLVDGTGTRLYRDNEIAALGKRSAKVIDRLFEKAKELSGIGDDDIEELTDELKNDQSG